MFHQLAIQNLGRPSLFWINYFNHLFILLLTIVSCRQPEYFGDEHIGTMSEGNLVRNGGSTSNYDSPPVSQPEVLKQQTPEVAQGNQYAFASSAPDFTYESPQQFNAAFTHPQTSSQMQNLASFSSVMVTR